MAVRAKHRTGRLATAGAGELDAGQGETDDLEAVQKFALAHAVVELHDGAASGEPPYREVAAAGARVGQTAEAGRACGGFVGSLLKICYSG